MNRSHVKNLGQVAAIVYSDKPPKNVNVLWYNVNDGRIYWYDHSAGEWYDIVTGIVGARNIGVGQFILQSPIGNVLNVRSLKGINGIDVTLSADGETLLIGPEPKIKALSPIQIAAPAISSNVFVVMSNIRWIITGWENYSWLKFDQKQGEGDVTFIVTALTANGSTSLRKATVMVTSFVSGVVTPFPVEIIQLGTTSQPALWTPNATDYTCQQ